MVILGPFWEFNYPTCQNYASEHIVPALAPMENRGVNEKYMLVNNVAADIKGKDIGFYLYKSIKKLNLGKPKYSLDSTKVRKREDLVVENTVYSDELNEVLKKMNFIDTTRTIFPDQRNTVYLNATIKKVAFRLVQREKETDRHIMYTDLTIEWDLLDYYKQKVYSTVTNTTSDGMIYLEKEETNKKGSESIFNKLVHDNMEYAIIDLKGKLKEKGLLKMSGNSEDSMMTLTLNTPASMAGKRLNDFLKSSVSVKVDDGHGSGVIISVDGYIVTNYHVVAGSKKVEVIFNDGSKLEATVVRKSPEVDLALLKVSRDSLLPLQLSSNDIPDIGGEVWAIGTPRSLELGQSVSKGIVSATRKSNDLTYIQTDVKISPGNSGGALVNRDGVVQGIVSAKLISTGTEGVGFAIPSAVVLKKLKIQYK
jgi:S1-C subfamily serine protease